jgi:4-amino-4-deoxy-L-arabinose transferase-like glycosyltransferase
VVLGFGRLERWLWLLPLLALGIWLVAHRDLPWALWGGDEMEYADVARRLARGDGFTTSLIYPAELSYGAERDHPSLVRAPLWPLVLAATFSLTGPHDWAIHATLLILYLATVALGTALGRALAGPAAGALAGIATATSPHALVLSLLGGTETLYALLVLAMLLLLARGQRPVWVGLVCGLAYLTRYNGIVLLPFAILWLLVDPVRRRRIPECLVGFVLVALPWWIRNVIVTGNPLFTYYRWAIFFSPNARTYTTTLLHMIDPDATAATAMNPVRKVQLLLPAMIVSWPVASANLSACIGVFLAALRRDRLSILFLLLSLATTLGLSLALPRGRYFAPLFPSLLVLGVVAWMRFGGRLRAAALAVLLAAPLLPPLPREAPDLTLLRRLVFHAELRDVPTPSRSCIRENDLVVGESASRLAWTTDATTIWMPASEEDFWRIVDAHPVEWVYLQRRSELLTERFAREFAPSPECGPWLHRRRAEPVRHRPLERAHFGDLLLVEAAQSHHRGQP